MEGKGFYFILLRRVYKSVDDVDLYLGGFLEAAHEDSILGPVFKCIIGDQFARLKKGDKFFYDLGVDQKRAFTLGQLDEIRKTSMARIICDNTDDIDRIQPLAFKMPTSRLIICPTERLCFSQQTYTDAPGATLSNARQLCHSHCVPSSLQRRFHNAL